MRLLYLLTALCLTGLLVAAATAQAATFTVTSNADAGAGTLRQAILDANANNNQPALDEIVFNAAMTITVLSQLPAIDEPVTVNGRQGANCSGAARNVQIDGNNGVIADVDGLTLAATADGSRICTLNVRNFGGVGIVVQSDSSTIDSSRVGTDLTGEVADSNDLGGISVTGANNTIGGVAAQPAAGSGNIISGNADPGLVATTGLVVSGTGTTIIGNHIGTDDEGDQAVANEFGVSIGSGAIGTTLGGTAAGAENVISGNTVNGADVDTGAIHGNHIGVTRAGTAALGNGGHGLLVGTAIQVGGTGAGEGNVISANGDAGIFLTGPGTVVGNVIGADKDGQNGLAVDQDFGILVQGIPGPATGAVIGGTAAGAGNVISGNNTAIEAFGTVDDLVIQGNTIGLEADGVGVLENDDSNIVLGSGVTDTQIGGTAAGARNYISGSTANAPSEGVHVGGADGTVIEGNTIGLDAAGGAAGNDHGVTVGIGGTLTRIGGTAPGARNVISGNLEQGVGLGIDSSNSTVQGNYIGVGPDGVTARPNGTGVRVEDSPTALIGGTAAGAGNVMSGNTQNGMFTAGETQGLVMQGNTIGLGANGTTDVGNGSNGIAMGSSTDAVIGGTTAAARNVISGNGSNGIQLQGGSNAGADIFGNRIGVASDGATARPNDQAGVEFTGIPQDVMVGGTGAGQGNVIAHNAEDGVRAIGASPAGGAGISGNSIHSNGTALAGEIGIDLGASGGSSLDDGVTPNDAGDGDGALNPNHLQNFPVVTSAQSNGAITGTIDTNPSQPTRLEFFSSASCDPEGHGQGEVFLGTTTITSGAGPTAFSANVSGTTAGRRITATATNTATNETSEFSQCFTATQTPAPPPPPPPPPPTTTTTTPPVVTPALVPKFPAKIRVLRNGVDDGVLDMLIEITARAKTTGADLDIAYESSGRTTKFSVPITGTQIKVRKKLPSSQPKDTGITTVTYAGNDIVDPDDVRLRAADGKSTLVRKTSTVTGGKLRVDGTVSSRARGVVRVRMSYAKPDASTAFLDFRAPIDDGKWSLNQTLPADAATGGHLSIQFTGYEAANLRGEQTSKQVP